MTVRKNKIFLTEFWTSYSVIASIVLASSPFLLLIAARGMFIPLILAIIFLVISGIISIVYAANSTRIIIEKENREIMNALRGIK